MNWSKLESANELRELSSSSSEIENKGFLLFKHSEMCGTSRMALRYFEAGFMGNIPSFLIHVREQRQLSDFIARHFKVPHESPQVLLIQNSLCVYHASHSDIDAGKVNSLTGSE